MNKHIIFDLDETIGYFKQFIVILNIIELYHPIDYNLYFELFEDYFRPNIFHIFEMILSKKKTKNIKYVVLYTNNNNDHYVNKVIEYIHKKLNAILFDHIITYNSNRLHKIKSYEDLIHCIPDIANGSLCFIDDKIHICMKSNLNVSYIKCEKYTYHLSNDEIISRLLKTNHYDKEHIKSILKKYKYSKKELPKSAHNYSSKKMLQHIEIFIYNIPVIKSNRFSTGII